jgi:hypothetical protein
MPSLTLWLGIILTALGIFGYIGSGAESVTALIPAFFGIVFILLGVLAKKERLRKHVMHAAAVLAVLGFAGSVRGLSSLFTLLGGGDVPRPLATIMQSVMALLMIAFIVLAVKSFVDARRQRGSSASTAT